MKTGVQPSLSAVLVWPWSGAAGGEEEDGDSTHRAVPDVAAHVGSSSTRKRRRREEADAEGAGASNNKKPRSVCGAALLHQRPHRPCVAILGSNEDGSPAIVVGSAGVGAALLHQRQRSLPLARGGGIHEAKLPSPVFSTRGAFSSASPSISPSFLSILAPNFTSASSPLMVSLRSS